MLSSLLLNLVPEGKAPPNILGKAKVAGKVRSKHMYVQSALLSGQSFEEWCVSVNCVEVWVESI